MRQHDLTERLLRLRGVPVFRGMSTSDLAPLAASMRPARFDRGQLLLREDEPPRALHLLVTGKVTLRRHGRRIQTVSAPGGVGFLALLARTAGGTEAVADEPTESFELRADAMDEMFEDHFQVLLGALHWINERLIEDFRDQEPLEYVPSPAFEGLTLERELGIVERIFLLRRASVFKTANVNSTARFAREMKEVRLPAGTVLWRPGDRADSTLFLVEGKMELRWNDGGTVQTVGPGYFVGGAESLALMPRWNELVATEPVVGLQGGREALIDMFEDDIDVALKFMSTMATLLLRFWDRRAEEEALARGEAGDTGAAAGAGAGAEVASVAP